VLTFFPFSGNDNAIYLKILAGEIVPLEAITAEEGGRKALLLLWIFRYGKSSYGYINRVVQKPQFLNNNRLKTTKTRVFGKIRVFWETCEITNRVISQVQ
jgi:hypothetical protein